MMTAQTFITILSAIGAILVIVYKIVKSKDYRESKQAEIELLKEQIAFAERRTYSEFQKDSTAIKETLGDKIAGLEHDLTESKKDIAEAHAKAKDKDRVAKLELHDLQKQHSLELIQLTLDFYTHLRDSDLDWKAAGQKLSERLDNLTKSNIGFVPFNPPTTSSPQETDDK